jgi:hypothetical protein
MNLEKLAANLQEEEKKLESRILPYCNPQQIANEIMSNLEKATPLQKSWTTPAGHHGEVGSLFTQYELWYINKPSQWDKKGLIRGPLANCSDKSELAQITLNLVKKYITEDIIKLDLDGCDDDYGSMMYIMAIISRTDVENLKKRIGVEKKDLFDW